MSKGKIIKKVFLVGIVLAAIGGGVVFYVFNAPHRDVQAQTADFELTSDALVSEYLADYSAANDKYLDDEGESKIIAITGTVVSVTENLNKEKVILLRSEGQDAGVRCTFTVATNHNAESIVAGTTITIKGVIRSGATYDEDLEEYEDVIIEKSDIN